MKIYVVFIASLGNFDGILLLYINKIKIKLSLLLEYIILRQIKLLSHLKSFICKTVELFLWLHSLAYNALYTYKDRYIDTMVVHICGLKLIKEKRKKKWILHCQLANILNS